MNIQEKRKNKYIEEFLNSPFYKQHSKDFLRVKIKIQLYATKKVNMTYKTLNKPLIKYYLIFEHNKTEYNKEIKLYEFKYLLENGLNVDYSGFNQFNTKELNDYYNQIIKHYDLLNNDEKRKLKQIELLQNKNYLELIKNIKEEGMYI